MYLAMGYVLNQAPNLDPRSSKFLTYDIGGQSIGIGSAWVSTARFLANATSQAITDPDQLIRIDSRDSQLNRFMTGQLAPTTRIGKNMIEGKNYFGEPTMDSWGSFLQNIVADGILPFWASGLMDTPKGGWAGMLGAVPEAGGLRSFPQSRYQHAAYLANIRALEQGDVSWDEMSGRERIQFRDDPQNADIDQLLQEATDNWAPRGSKQDIRKHEYFSQIRLHMENEYRPKLDELTTILEGHLRSFDDAEAYAEFAAEQTMEYSIGGGKYNLQTVEGVRQAISGLGGQLGGFYDELQSEYPDVVLDLDQKRLDKMETAPLEDLAYYEYISEVVLQEFSILNSAGDVIGYDTAARREANDAFKSRLGNYMYQLVRDRRTMTKDSSPLLQEL